MAVKTTPGNTDDRKALEEIVHDLQGKCSADNRFIGKDIFHILATLVAHWRLRTL